MKTLLVLSMIAGGTSGSNPPPATPVNEELDAMIEEAPAGVAELLERLKSSPEFEGRAIRVCRDDDCKILDRSGNSLPLKPGQDIEYIVR